MIYDQGLHKKTTKVGSNQYYERISCVECKTVISKTKKEHKPSTSSTDQETCTHQNTTASGTNQYYKRVTCKDCKKVLVKEAVSKTKSIATSDITAKSSSNTEQPEISQETCAHQNTTASGTNQYSKRLTCKDCKKLLVYEQVSKSPATSGLEVEHSISNKDIPTSSSKAKDNAEKVFLDSNQCLHVNASRKGTNQHQSLWSCPDCGLVRRDWANPGDRMTGVEELKNASPQPAVNSLQLASESEAALPKESGSGADSSSKPCAHANISKKGSNQHKTRKTCKDCGVLISVEDRKATKTTSISEKGKDVNLSEKAGAELPATPAKNLSVSAFQTPPNILSPDVDGSTLVNKKVEPLKSSGNEALLVNPSTPSTAFKPSVSVSGLTPQKLAANYVNRSQKATISDKFEIANQSQLRTTTIACLHSRVKPVELLELNKLSSGNLCVECGDIVEKESKLKIEPLAEPIVKQEEQPSLPPQHQKHDPAKLEKLYGKPPEFKLPISKPSSGLSLEGSLPTPIPAGTKVCLHSKTSKKGSNQHVSREKCISCGHTVSEVWKNK
ncbi:hypothetical protein HDU97_003806 [Phlyctochytrium planicorne]|nr:hypothetical protein HDU97_003806 [Phlyctochytrium planicorne]